MFPLIEPGAYSLDHDRRGITCNSNIASANIRALDMDTVYVAGFNRLSISLTTIPSVHMIAEAFNTRESSKRVAVYLCSRIYSPLPVGHPRVFIGCNRGPPCTPADYSPERGKESG